MSSKYPGDLPVQLIRRKCAVCGNIDNLLPLYDQPTENIAGIGDIGYHHIINVCNDCGFVFASPIIEESAILSYYEKMSNYEYTESAGIRPIEEVRQIERQIKFALSHFSSNFTGSALDVGCSIALGLSLLKNIGWNVLGLDPSERCIRISKNMFGVQVIKGFFSLELFQDKNPFDLIILSHVIEHVISPNEMLKEIRELLDDNGVIYIEVPNLMKNIGLRGYFTFEHVKFFTLQTLTNLAVRNGFAVDRIQEFDNGKDIYPYYPVIALTLKKSKVKIPLINERNEAIKIIEKYKLTTRDLLNKLDIKIIKILSHIKKGRLAIWGAGIHTSQLLSESVLNKESIYCIFDNDPKKAGLMISGIEIKTLPSNIEDVVKNIDGILISSLSSEDAIYRKIKFLENHNIAVFRLYFDE
jgi:2-polyprenyl-3-methyl-5-hydroxy-6-metoxy-1,4-benzoquinol methylase